MENCSNDELYSKKTNSFKKRLKATNQPGTEIGECGQLYSVNPCVLLELPCVVIEVHSAVLDLISLLIPVVRESNLFMFCIYG